MTDDPDLPRAHTRLRGWVALVLPAVAWFVYEIGLAAALRLSCTVVGLGLGATWGGLSLLICGAGYFLGRSARGGRPAAHWLERVAVWSAGLFALAIAFQTAATLLVPPCAR